MAGSRVGPLFAIHRVDYSAAIVIDRSRICSLHFVPRLSSPSRRFRNAPAVLARVRPYYTLVSFLVTYRAHHSSSRREKNSPSFGVVCTRRLRTTSLATFSRSFLRDGIAAEENSVACAHRISRCADVLAPACHRVTVYIGRATRRVASRRRRRRRRRRPLDAGPLCSKGTRDSCGELANNPPGGTTLRSALFAEARSPY